MERDTTGQWGGFTDRGQSVFDFSIGVSLFLVVVISVLVFVPTAFTSFTSDAGGVSAMDSLLTRPRTTSRSPRSPATVRRPPSIPIARSSFSLE